MVDSGYVPLVFSACLMTLMLTWIRGAKILAEQESEAELPIGVLLSQLKENPPKKIGGIGLFIGADPDVAPAALVNSLRHFRIIHEKVAVITVEKIRDPFVKKEERVWVEELIDGFFRIKVRFGYLDEPDLSETLRQCSNPSFDWDLKSVSYVLSRRMVFLSDHSVMPGWQRRLFLFLLRNAEGATEYLKLPPKQIMEISMRMEI